MVFVARPDEAPTSESTVYARPDYVSVDGARTWRQRLLSYNAQPGENVWGLLPAYKLYQPEQYRGLVDRFGAEHVFILSAGWGIIRSDFLTPNYDITLSRPSEKEDRYKWRRLGDHCEDFCHLPADDTDPVIFLGGKNYLPLFEGLTGEIAARKTIYYRSTAIEQRHGFIYEKYDCRRSTNWHYSCATDLIAGRL